MVRMINLNLADFLPLVERIMFHLSNMIGERNTLRIFQYGIDYRRIKILGIFEYQTGSSLVLELKCTPRAFMILQKHFLKGSFKHFTNVQVIK